MFKWSKNRFFTLSRFLLVIFVIFFIFSYSLANRFSVAQKQGDFVPDDSLAQKISLLVAYPFMSLFNIYDGMVEAEQKRQRDCNQHMMTSYIALQKKYKLLEEQNNHLKALTKFAYKDTEVIATARPIITTAGFFSKIIRINAGIDKNIKIGDIAVTEEGLVGRVVKVYQYTTDILPIHHSLSKIAGMTKRENVKLLISGRPKEKVVAEYASEPLLLQKGDEVITLSDGGRLPYGIRIGTIKDVDKKPIPINLSVNFGSLDYIQIIRLNQEPHGPPTKAESIKQKSKEEPAKKKDVKNT